MKDLPFFVVLRTPDSWCVLNFWFFLVISTQKCPKLYCNFWIPLSEFCCTESLISKEVQPWHLVFIGFLGGGDLTKIHKICLSGFAGTPTAISNRRLRQCRLKQMTVPVSKSQSSQKCFDSLSNTKTFLRCSWTYGLISISSPKVPKATGPAE